jgi:beta-glucosidase
MDEPDQPLFAFGYGLSYSVFRLDSLQLPARIGRDDTLSVKVRITNTSDRAGDEVPQLYIRPRVASTVQGQRLQAYRRVHLAPQESKLVEFAIPAGNLAVLDPRDHWALEPGVYEVLLGNSSVNGLTGTFELIGDARVAQR